MRIAHVTATFPPYGGGTGHVCYHNARELVRRGHHVHVFTARVEGAPAREVKQGIRVRRLRPLFQIGNAPLLPQLLWCLRGFDLVHLHYPFIMGAEFTRLAAILSATPLVVTLHNDLIGDGLRAGLFAAYQRFSTRFTVRHAAVLCAVSLDHYLHCRLRRALGNDELPVVEVPNGIDTGTFRPGLDGAKIRDRYDISRRAKVLLFVGALDRAHHYRRLDLLIETVAESDDPDLLLVVVGEGGRREAYCQLARRLDVKNQVRFLGRLDNQDLPAVYAASDVVVLPSDIQESFGLVLIEAMACEKPVIGTDLPGVRTVVSPGKDGHLALPGDSCDLAHKIETMLALPSEKRREMGTAGRRKVQARFTWQGIGARLERVYRRILSEHSSVAASEESEVGVGL